MLLTVEAVDGREPTVSGVLVGVTPTEVRTSLRPAVWSYLLVPCYPVLVSPCVLYRCKSAIPTAPKPAML
jgi:hypothetical protein